MKHLPPLQSTTTALVYMPISLQQSTQLPSVCCHAETCFY